MVPAVRPGRTATGVSVVITGASGYIGMHLVAALLEHGSDVVAMVRPGSASRVPEGVTVAEADITDPGSLAPHIRMDDRVVHLACLAMGPSEVDRAQAFRVNALGTFNVLQAAAAGGAARVVLASSAQVYGRPRRVPMDEGHPTRPITTYGASKLAGEVFAPVFGPAYLDGVTVLRIFNVFGKPMDGRRRGTFETLVVERARDSLPAVIHGSAGEARDFVHVDDVVRSLVSAVHSSVTGVYNIGSGRACRLQRLALAAGIAPHNLTVVPSAESEAPMVFEADISRARADLGFRPTVDVVDFVRSLARDNA